MRKLLMAALAALFPSLAIGADCVNAPVATYTAPGFSCTVGGLTFSDFQVSLDKEGAGSTALGNVTPVKFGDRRGFTLNYVAAVYGGGNATLSVSYTVSGGVRDALAAVTGVATNGGQLLYSSQVGSAFLIRSGEGSTSVVVAGDNVPVRSTLVVLSGEGSATSGLMLNTFGGGPAQ